jgi:hypothetical protein
MSYGPTLWLDEEEDTQKGLEILKEEMDRRGVKEISLLEFPQGIPEDPHQPFEIHSPLFKVGKFFSEKYGSKKGAELTLRFVFKIMGIDTHPDIVNDLPKVLKEGEKWNKKK